MVLESNHLASDTLHRLGDLVVHCGPARPESGKSDSRVAGHSDRWSGGPHWRDVRTRTGGGAVRGGPPLFLFSLGFFGEKRGDDFRPSGPYRRRERERGRGGRRAGAPPPPPPPAALLRPP